MNDVPESAEKPDYSTEKARLECEKLHAEIAAIKRPFHKSTAFYIAFAPVAIAVAGVMFTWASGWFDVQRTRVSNDKTLLEAETTRLSLEKDKLTEQTDTLKAAQQSLDAQKLEAKQSLIAMTNTLESLRRELDEKTKLITAVNDELTALTNKSAYAEAVIKQVAGVTTERDRAQSEVAELKIRLAAAYERSRVMVVDAQNLLMTMSLTPANFQKFNTANSEYSVDVGKWRVGYEEDTTRFSLNAGTNAALGVSANR